MNRLLAQQLDELLNAPGERYGFAWESALRVGAATLMRAVGDEITSTTVVGVLGNDDQMAFEALVADLANEFGLDVTIRQNDGSFSVRFSRPGAVAHEPPSPPQTRSLLDRFSQRRRQAAGE
jgi:hypothetical protein